MSIFLAGINAKIITYTAKNNVQLYKYTLHRK